MTQPQIPLESLKSFSAHNSVRRQLAILSTIRVLAKGLGQFARKVNLCALPLVAAESPLIVSYAVSS